MIHIDANGGDSAVIESKVRSERALLKQRVAMQHREMDEAAQRAMEEIEDDEEEKPVSKKNGVVSVGILSGTVQGRMAEKRLLKKLNVMDFVHHGKDVFFREVEE